MVWVGLSPAPAEGVKPAWTLGDPFLPSGRKSGSDADGSARELGSSFRWYTMAVTSAPTGN